MTFSVIIKNTFSFFLLGYVIILTGLQMCV